MEACPSELKSFFNTVRRLLIAALQNLAFAKDEAKFTIKKVQHKLTGGLGGREPDVETET